MKLNKNIYNLRKEKGFSQEYVAEKINVARQTISNWELGETSPNPDQLLLLSKVLETSVDDLLGNKKSFKVKKEKNNYIYLGLIIVCGCFAGIWSFSANRFQVSEIFLIIIGGVAIGYGLALVINDISKKIEYQNKEDNIVNNYSKKEDIKHLIPTICRCIAIAMGIAVVVLNVLNELKTKDAVSMLGIGLFCLGLSLISKNN